MDSLKILKLRNNAIESLPNNTFNDNLNLEILELSENVIDTIHSSVFSSTRRLKELHLEKNLINRTQRNFLTYLPVLEILNLSDNICVNRNFNRTELEDVKSSLATCFYNYDGNSSVNLIANWKFVLLFTGIVGFFFK